MFAWGPFRAADIFGTGLWRMVFSMKNPTANFSMKTPSIGFTSKQASLTMGE